MQSATVNQRYKIDVLINVNIMSEGSDVPDIQTVFLTRPTQSEGFLVQMVGRGMRGKKYGGTEKLNIVDFHDQWDVFKNWLNPEFVFSKENLEAEVNPEILKTESDDEELTEEQLFEIEWKKILEVYNSIKLRFASYKRRIMLPVGWFTLDDEDGYPYRMLIFNDQIKGINKFRKSVDLWKNDLSFTPFKVLRTYFNYFCSAPSEKDISVYMNHVRNNNTRPVLYLFNARMKIDPYYVSKSELPEGKSLEEYAEEIYNSSEEARDIFGSCEDYVKAVTEAKDNDAEDYIGSKVEEFPLEFIPYKMTPRHDLERLTAEMVRERFKGKFDGIKSVEWTDECYKGYFGVHYPDGRVYINKILNSEEVDPEVIKFVLYHEFLHQNIHGHGKDFKELEHKYPNWEKCEEFLLGKFPEFDIKYYN